MSPAGGLAKLRLARREGRALIYAGRVEPRGDQHTRLQVRRSLSLSVKLRVIGRIIANYTP